MVMLLLQLSKRDVHKEGQVGKPKAPLLPFIKRLRDTERDSETEDCITLGETVWLRLLYVLVPMV